MNRRSFLALLAFGGAATTLRTLTSAHPQDMTPVPIGTPGATPSPDLPLYTGDAQDIWDRPWKIERTLIAFDAIIDARYIGEDGAGFTVNADGDVYRSLLLMALPDSPKRLAVATQDDLAAVDGRHTAHVVGVFGGLYTYEDGGAWTVPLIVASSVSPVKGT